MSSSNEGRIPVIDISGSVPQSEVAKQLVDAAATFGFVYIKNLGKDIPVDAIDRTFELSQKFFSSPVEEKLPCKIANNNRGWSGMHTEKLDEKNQRVGDFKEAFNLGDFVDGKADQPLPPSLSPHESELNDFQLYCHKLCLKLLTLFAIGLEIDPAAGGSDWFSSRHHGVQQDVSFVCSTILPCPQILTTNPMLIFELVLIQTMDLSPFYSVQRPSQPGLEILPPSSSSEPKWTPVPIQPPTTENDPSPPILVNIGDLLSHWTNNLLVSTVHRVIFPKSLPTEIADRYSIAYFCHPVGTTVLESVPSERVQKFGEANGEIERKKGEKITADEHLMGRLRATYAGLYEENKGDKKE
ncbi:2og-fe oxygenase [Botrytis cinerea]